MTLNQHYHDRERFAVSDHLFDASLAVVLENDLPWEDCVTLGNNMYERGFRRAPEREHHILYRRRGGNSQSLEITLVGDVKLKDFMEKHPKKDWVIYSHQSRAVGGWINELL